MRLENDRLDRRAVNKHNILYVDDEVINLKVFKETFKRYYNVFLAQSGKEGLKILDEVSIDLVVTDQRMPEMSGTQFLEKVVHKFPEVLRMIMTGHSDLEVIIKSINDFGVHQYITKPWNSESLKIVFDSFLNKQNKELSKLGEGTVGEEVAEDKIKSYAKTLISYKDFRVDIVKKYFENPIVVNYSKECEGKENIFIHEFRGEDSFLFLMVNCSVNEIEGSLIKSSILDYGKDFLISNKLFNPIEFFTYLSTISVEIVKQHFYDNITIGLTVFFSHNDKPNDWVITNSDMIFGYKDDQIVTFEDVESKSSQLPGDNSKIYRINKEVCDNIYMYSMDTLTDKDVFEGNLLHLLDSMLNASYGEKLISLQSFLNSSISDSGVDKFCMVGLEYN